MPAHAVLLPAGLAQASFLPFSTETLRCSVSTVSCPRASRHLPASPPMSPVAPRPRRHPPWPRPAPDGAVQPSPQLLPWAESVAPPSPGHKWPKAQAVPPKASQEAQHVREPWGWAWKERVKGQWGPDGPGIRHKGLGSDCHLHHSPVPGCYEYVSLAQSGPPRPPHLRRPLPGHRLSSLSPGVNSRVSRLPPPLDRQPQEGTCVCFIR